MNDATTTTEPITTGTWLEIRGLPGLPTRRGLVLDVIGAGEHRHFRMRWDDEHESLFFPADGAVHVLPPRADGG